MIKHTQVGQTPLTLTRTPLEIMRDYKELEQRRRGLWGGTDTDPGIFSLRTVIIASVVSLVIGSGIVVYKLTQGD